DSTGKQLALDFANGLVIVTVIGTMTFGIVLLYKYRCMKFLMGYMAFSSMTLLGVLGAELFNVAIEKYRIPIDWFTFVFSMFNFAVVGVTSIFYAKGIPPYITQTYLICSSVIIAWQLSHFDTISTWTLLIMLALYDLCAVLTPVGPLRLLVNLMSDEDSPEMPGLLYEAQIPEGLKRPVMGGRNKDDNGDEGEHDDSSQSPPASMSAERYQQPSIKENGVPGRTSSDVSASQGDDSAPGVEMSSAVNRTRNDSYDSVTLDQSENNATTTPDLAPAHASSSAKTAMIPFAIAELFSNTIKLGLGDFIFYSVLVAKSAQYSFACFVSSFLVVLAGLGGTLVLLAVFKHALPALPISIFLAVTFYVFTRFIIEPW
ncbi:presenilin, partial [Thalassiosira pseudonana CCMP1335]